MKRKLLSVIIPSYNVEQYLEKTVESLLSAKKREYLDIIIVNDGSKDKTINIAMKFKKLYPDIVRVIDKENGGHGSTINAGIYTMEGKYGFVLDGDDWIEYDTLDKILDILKESEIDILVSNYKMINETNGNIELRRCQVPNYEISYNLEYLNRHGIFLPMATIIVNINILKRIPKISEYTFYVDEEYCSYVFSYAKSIKFINEVLYCYRIGNVNQSMNISNQLKRMEHKERVLTQLLKLKNNNNFQPQNQLYLKRKIIGMSKNLFELCLMYNDDHRNGRLQAKHIKELLVQYEMFSYVSKFYILMLIFSHIGLNSRCIVWL